MVNFHTVQNTVNGAGVALLLAVASCGQGSVTTHSAVTTSTVDVVQAGQVALSQPLREGYAAEYRLDIPDSAPLLETVTLQGATLIPMSQPQDPGWTSYAANLDSVLHPVTAATQLTLPLPDGTPVRVVHLTDPVTSEAQTQPIQLIYQSNAHTPTINDVALMLAYLQVNPKTPEVLAERANILLATPGQITAQSLDPVPDSTNTDFVAPFGIVNIVDLAAVLATIQEANPTALTVAARINDLLGAPNFVSAADMLVIPGQGIPGAIDAVVTNANDSGDGSLREAMASAQVGEAVTITFDPVFFGQSRTITLTSPLETIPGQNLTIVGPGDALLTISGNSQNRIFTVRSNQDFRTSLMLKNMTLSDGVATPINDGGRRGGAIVTQDQAQVTVTNVTFRNNQADDGGGAIYSETNGTLTVDGSLFEDNIAIAGNDERGAGGIGFRGPNQLTVTNTVFRGNRGINGAAINNLVGRVVLDNITCINNDVEAATRDTGEARPTLRGYGGCIYSDRVSPASDTDTVNIFQIRNSTFENNRSLSAGGALYLFTGGSDGLLVENSTFLDNRSENEDIQSNNLAEQGNGAAIELQSNEINQGLTITDTTFARNRARDRGGAIRMRNASPVRITNSTFDDNGTTLEFTGSFTGGLGGALRFSNSPDTVITNVTFSNNFATWVGGAISGPGGSNVTVNNSIFFANTGQQGGQLHSECILDGTGNLQEPGNGRGGSCGGLIIPGTLEEDPLLESLADNGGSTATRALPSNSPAVDAGDTGTCAATDQRGISRPQGSGCDIGAYEQVP